MQLTRQRLSSFYIRELIEFVSSRNSRLFLDLCELETEDQLLLQGDVNLELSWCSISQARELCLSAPGHSVWLSLLNSMGVDLQAANYAQVYVQNGALATREKVNLVYLFVDTARWYTSTLPTQHLRLKRYAEIILTGPLSRNVVPKVTAHGLVRIVVPDDQFEDDGAWLQQLLAHTGTCIVTLEKRVLDDIRTLPSRTSVAWCRTPRSQQTPENPGVVRVMDLSSHRLTSCSVDHPQRCERICDELPAELL